MILNIISWKWNSNSGRRLEQVADVTDIDKSDLNEALRNPIRPEKLKLSSYQCIITILT